MWKKILAVIAVLTVSAASHTSLLTTSIGRVSTPEIIRLNNPQFSAAPGYYERIPSNVSFVGNNQARVWRSLDSKSLQVDTASIGEAILLLGADQGDPVWLIADADYPALPISRVVETLDRQGFRNIALVSPGGWNEPPPPLKSDEMPSEG